MTYHLVFHVLLQIYINQRKPIISHNKPHRNTLNPSRKYNKKTFINFDTIFIYSLTYITYLIHINRTRTLSIIIPYKIRKSYNELTIYKAQYNHSSFCQFYSNEVKSFKQRSLISSCYVQLNFDISVDKSFIADILRQNIFYPYFYLKLSPSSTSSFNKNRVAAIS